MLRWIVGSLLVMTTLLAARAAEPEKTWALRSLRRPDIPSAPNARNPIDAFVLVKLQEKGLTPAPEADRRTLIRRLYFDLLGLPPSPQEIDAFLADSAVDAYERLVDRLLASPHHGERWARHWMDAVHFAETHGHDQDRVRVNAWPYRDYLITAFNEDRRYDRFVQEQVAGDALFPDRPDRLPAVGLLAAGPWDESSLRDIREDSIDRQVGYYLDRDDMVSTVIATFNSLTVHCARCHDHKFDPITQDEYYSLQAVFAGVGRADRPFDSDPAVASRRRDLRARLAALDAKSPAILPELRSPALGAEIQRWEQREPKPVLWRPLAVKEVVSANGASLTKLPDGSILSGGMKPERDTYTITGELDSEPVTAIRLELLTDDSLPKHGPGRQDNGNLHLNEIRLLIAAQATPNETKPLTIAAASADFDQDGWTVRHAFDGQPNTAWGIYPQVGKPHSAIFELKEPLKLASAALLTIALEQTHGGGHLIGRFRLSVTDAKEPRQAMALPPDVAKVLAVAPEKRSQEERDQIARHYLRTQCEADLAKLPAPRLVYAAGHDFAPDGSHKPPKKPRPVHVLKRGDINRPQDEARPGTLACIKDLPPQFDLADPDDEASRRVALARWLVDPKNPLTWRSIVNRVWHHHFGRGIVDTPNDFGAMGGRPTHPELLDWLAIAFRDGNQSIKNLHRLIVTSATYRQSSAHQPENARRDADNRYLWRMNRGRLDAESVRDAILAASERLDTRMGGPSDQQFTMKPGIHVTPLVDYLAFKWDRQQQHRRSVYRLIFRTLPDPFIDCLDGADPSQLTPARNASVTPLQSLALMNNAFVLENSKACAAALERATSDTEGRVALACERVWGRTPSPAEMAEMRAFADKHGLANLCRLLFNSSEFLFVN